jgi:hypothetical protein
MSEVDERHKKALARGEAAQAKAATLTTKKEVQELVSKLAAAALEHAAVAARLAAVGKLTDFRMAALRASAELNVASELDLAFGGGRPIALQRRLDSARERVAEHAAGDDWLIKHKKVAEKAEAAAAAKAAKKTAKAGAR